jgi:hypothetical protein
MFSRRRNLGMRVYRGAERKRMLPTLRKIKGNHLSIRMRLHLKRSWSLKIRSGVRHCTWWVIVLLPLAPLGPPSESATPSPREYWLRFCHTHTNERLDIMYRRGENYLPEALAELDHYLRDHRTGEVRHFDPRLFDLLHDLTDSRGEIDVVCG